MPADDALLLALVIAGLIVLLAGKRRRSQVFGAVLTKSKKGQHTVSAVRSSSHHRSGSQQYDDFAP